MERITGRLDDGSVFVHSETGDEGVGYDTIPRRLHEIITRLAAYEDTGLEPEEIEGIKSLAVLGLMSDVKRARAIMDAEREDRLLVLPCKVGDPVYVLCGEKVERYTVMFFHVYASQIYIDVSRDGGVTFRMVAMNKTCFLSQEEAEKALKQEG